MNKEELIKRANSLELELNKLKEEINKPDNLFSKINNYYDVCENLREAPESCPYKQIKQIEKLFNGSWKIDLTNPNQKKWYPYFEIKKNFEVFYYASYCHLSSFCGQIAFYKDEETASFVGKKFIDIYKKIISTDLTAW